MNLGSGWDSIVGSDDNFINNILYIGLFLIRFLTVAFFKKAHI